MSHHEDDENPVIDRLVRKHLEKKVSGVDSSNLVSRILSEQTEMPPVTFPAFSSSVVEKKPERNFHWSRFVSWWGISSLAIVVAFFCGRHFSPLAANASLVLQDVQSVHAQGRDYCYRVRFDPDPRYINPDNPLGGPSLTHLWTRGDRFWADCKIGDLTFKLGREANGTVWISPSPQKGIRFSNQLENLPKTIAQICQINSMDVPLLMNEVLVDFDLSSRIISSSSAGKRTLVWAQLKPGRTHPLLSHALLEIDTHSNILTRLVLWTVHEGKPHGIVAFTLLETGNLSDEKYELVSYLAADAVIETQTLPSPDYEPDFEQPEKQVPDKNKQPDE